MARSMAHDSVEALELRVGLAWLLYVEGNAAGAEAAARESADESRRVLGPAHRNAAEAKRVLGYLLAAAGKEAEAIEPYRTAIEISERGGAGGLRVTARYRCELGKALLALKRYPEAISELETAGAIEIKNHSEQTPEARTCRFTLAETYRGVGDHARAVAVLEALVADLGSAPDPRAQMWLGIELAASGGDAKRARSLVAAARTQLPADDEESIRAAAAWLRTH